MHTKQLPCHVTHIIFSSARPVDPAVVGSEALDLVVLLEGKT